MRRLHAALAGLAIAALAAVAAVGARAQDPRPASGQVQYFLLALSWSPSYCADPQNAARDPGQCAIGAGHNFIVHGLWPQLRDRRTSGCPSTQPADVPDALARAQLDLMPSLGLIQYQWDRHGTCSGLPQAEYFALLRRLRGQIAIPAAYRRLSSASRVTAAQVEQAFLAANPKLRADQLVITCDERRIREVRVCFSTAGAPRACGPGVTERCGSAARTMAPVR